VRITKYVNKFYVRKHVASALTPTVGLHENITVMKTQDFNRKLQTDLQTVDDGEYRIESRQKPRE